MLILQQFLELGIIINQKDINNGGLLFGQTVFLKVLLKFLLVVNFESSGYILDHNCEILYSLIILVTKNN